ncbi:MAG: helix-turn-helix transcriptional regulator [Gammaproteobacteria bacterium]
MTDSDPQQLEKPDITAEELVDQVGMRVRAIRSRRGLTRKNLAFHSNISERYLAQVEGGTANISLTLLSRIARALGVHVGSLLPFQADILNRYEPLHDLINTLSVEQQHQAYQVLRDTFTTDRASRMGVALVGLRGAGKSTLGSLLAKHFKAPFVRLDEVIAQLSGMDMGELISLRGQDVYRRFELEALQQTIADYRFVVVETGGSLISEAETYRVLRSHYFTVWIRAIPEDHMQRVIAQGDLRPISGNTKAMQDLKLILEERQADYRLADHELLTSARSIEECMDELITICTPVLQGHKDIPA